MKYVILISSIWIFIKTLSYGIFEIKNNSNNPGGITVIIVNIISFIFVNILLFTMGIY